MWFDETWLAMMWNSHYACSFSKLYDWTVEPSSDFYYRWLAVITLAVTYNLIIIIARAVLPDLQVLYRAVWITLDYLSDVVYLLDMVVRLRTSKRATIIRSSWNFLPADIVNVTFCQVLKRTMHDVVFSILTCISSILVFYLLCVTYSVG